MANGKGPVSSFISDRAAGRYRWEAAKVECYAGYRGEETPRAITLCGIRLPVSAILSRKRFLDSGTGRTVEIFECRLMAGWTISLERSDDASWRVRKNIFVPRVDLN
ncbi:MAG TPA: hypothetical protein VMS75_03600 [Terriglobales bacterium]|nr:hypothetical protein [Terriglobales bacterium]